MADVEEIKKRLDIVAVISDYLTLKKSGISFKAVCPFHSEKTPSFTVSPERQSWHCFGCGEGGDVISFVQKIDGLTFTEALERLAPRAGVEYQPSSPADNRIKSEKSKIMEVLELCARLFHEILQNHPTAIDARNYLEKRGIDAESIKKFRIGYAPNAWETVSSALTKKNLDLKWGFAAGMIAKRTHGNSYYDRFRGRIVFPIDNQSGQIIGFTGRILNDIKDQPKYLNTPETPVFKKSEVLYGISLAKNAIRDKGFAVLMEGQMDVIAAHQFGFNNTVATSGTALTAEH
jgi:DNA primase